MYIELVTNQEERNILAKAMFAGDKKEYFRNCKVNGFLLQIGMKPESLLDDSFFAEDYESICMEIPYRQLEETLAVKNFGDEVAFDTDIILRINNNPSRHHAKVKMIYEDLHVEGKDYIKITFGQKEGGGETKVIAGKCIDRYRVRF